MFRITPIGLVGLVWLTASPFCLAQTRDRRLDDALTDIALLKRVIKEQDRRIADLEKAVKALQTAQAAQQAQPVKPAVEERVKIPLKLPAAGWHNPLAWTQIREGMPRAQVEEILGKPTSVESVIDYQTLVYKGDVPGSGTLTGTVKLTDDRVSEVIPPEF